MAPMSQPDLMERDLVNQTMELARRRVKKNEVRSYPSYRAEPSSCHLSFSTDFLTSIVSRAGTRSVSTLSPAQYVYHSMILSGVVAFEPDPEQYGSLILLC